MSTEARATQFSTMTYHDVMKPPSHLTSCEAFLWAAAEQARRRGDRSTYWRLRRAMLLRQAARYPEALPGSSTQHPSSVDSHHSCRSDSSTAGGETCPNTRSP